MRYLPAGAQIDGAISLSSPRARVALAGRWPAAALERGLGRRERVGPLCGHHSSSDRRPARDRVDPAAQVSHAGLVAPTALSGMMDELRALHHTTTKSR